VLLIASAKEMNELCVRNDSQNGFGLGKRSLRGVLGKIPGEPSIPS
jgi:hypothetical protein